MSERLAVVVPVYNELRIDETLTALYDQNYTDTHHYVVDNGSTDNTRARINEFALAYDDFPLTVLEEDEKGTGAASDTGFRQAIEDGYELVARTDGDTLPPNGWTNRIVQNFLLNQQVQLLGGKSRAARDKYYRRGDDILLPLAVKSARLTLSIWHRDGDYRRVVVGHNMATRSAAYEQVGGFDRTAIDDQDEDIEYTLKVAREFGRAAILIDPKLEVATSMRRIRTYGIGGTALHHLLPGMRTKLHKDIDIR